MMSYQMSRQNQHSQSSQALLKMQQPIVLKAKIIGIQDDLNKWEKKQNWTYSKQREDFFDSMYALEEIEEVNNNITNRNSIDSKVTQQTTTSLPHTITQRALQIQRRLLDLTLSIVHMRRKTPKIFNTVDLGDGKYYELENIIQATYFCLFDMFEVFLKQPFNFYKYMTLQSQISWLTYNKTLPKKYRYLTQNMFKRLFIDYYAMHSKYTTKQILQIYDADIIIQAYFRAVLKIKGKGQPQNMQDFTKIPRWDALASYFAKHCITRFKYVSQTSSRIYINIQIVSKIFNVVIQSNKAYLKVF